MIRSLTRRACTGLFAATALVFAAGAQAQSCPSKPIKIVVRFAPGGANMNDALKADMSHVPYKGEAPMMQDLLGGQIQMAYASALQAKPHIDAGKIKAIGVTGEHRIAVLPNVPTLQQQGLNDEVYR